MIHLFPCSNKEAGTHFINFQDAVLSEGGPMQVCYCSDSSAESYAACLPLGEPFVVAGPSDKGVELDRRDVAFGDGNSDHYALLTGIDLVAFVEGYRLDDGYSTAWVQTDLVACDSRASSRVDVAFEGVEDGSYSSQSLTDSAGTTYDWKATS